jgi:hypothetical protein
MFSVFAASAEEAGDASESYICIAEQATGFLFNPSEGRWNSTGFNVEHGRYRLTIYAAPEPLRIGSPEMMHGEVRQVGRDDKRGFSRFACRASTKTGVSLAPIREMSRNSEWTSALCVIS